MVKILKIFLVFIICFGKNEGMSFIKKKLEKQENFLKNKYKIDVKSTFKMT